MMGKILSEARPVRKPPPKDRRGRPASSNPGFVSKAGEKFIMTISSEDFSLLAEKALEMGVTVQNYLRIKIHQSLKEEW